MNRFVEKNYMFRFVFVNACLQRKMHFRSIPKPAILPVEGVRSHGASALHAPAGLGGHVPEVNGRREPLHLF